MLRRTLAGGLMLAATGLALSSGTAAHADIYAPYARAAAIIDADGDLNEYKNVKSSRRVAVGKYCIRVADNVDIREAVIQLTPRQGLRLPYIAFRYPSATCNDSNTLAVHVFNTSTGRFADGAFDLTIA
ncbi:hypothetical protein ITP53_38635 [Nonomuraea sp. K274]|uniref:Uncharacterized protein n=1 Tax=Nonomuraea cypriaca TaxID=1187855 RepID=A0A931AI83_9ACTN|nr:hypothetical protein [Nonomuraea cypriaca]MBF8191514.1 hypothetical protein [Nonomuraea cypriaca]